MKRSIITLVILLCVMIITSSCKKFQEVENLNNPDAVLVFNRPDDLLKITGGLFNKWFQTTHDYNSLAITMWVGADWGTCPWGGVAMFDFSCEPRKEWNNNASYAYAQASEELYTGLYGMLTEANIILDQLANNEIEIGDNVDTKMVEAFSRLAQGLALGYIGLIYDQGFIITENTDLQKPLPADKCQKLINSALQSLDKCIAVCVDNTFTLPSEWIPGNIFTNVEIGKLANSMAARILLCAPRNKTQNNTTDWQRLKAYAQNGIDFDFAPLADDKVWYSHYHTYTVYPGWGQVDMRVVHMMDTTMPDYFPASGLISDLPNNGQAISEDARLLSDFEYMSTCPFVPSRGYYHFSSYRYSRLDQYITTWSEPMPEMRKAENDLMLAEAELMLGNKTAAINILNAGSRISRGKLPPVSNTASDAQVEEAIMYERTIELFITSCGLPFFDMRRKNMLQKGTPLHFPIPGKQLEVMMMPYYTFGGYNDANGVNTSNSGWNNQ